MFDAIVGSVELCIGLLFDQWQYLKWLENDVVSMNSASHINLMMYDVDIHLSFMNEII